MTLQELREKAEKLAQQIQRMHADYQERKKAGQTGADLWPDDTLETWRTVNKEYDDTLAAIEAANEEAEMAARAAAAEEWLARAGSDDATPEDHPDPLDPGTTYRQLGATDRQQATQLQQARRDEALCFQVWSTRGISGIQLTDEHREACQRRHFDPVCPSLEYRLFDTDRFRAVQRRMASLHPEARLAYFEDVLEGRALNTGIGASGGFITLPPTVVRAVELAQLAYGTMLGVAEVMTTETGEEMGWPVGTDTSNTGRYTDENVDNDTETDPTFESVTWRSYDLTSDFVKVPFRTMRDNFLNLEAVLGAMLGERLGRKLGTETTLGTEGKIRGVMQRGAAGQTAAATTAIAYADVVGLEHSVDPALRGRASFMFHDNILEKLRLIVDGDSRPLWASNIREGVPDTFNGRPYTINQAMSSTVTASDKTMLFGDMSYYKIRRVGPSLRIVRLVERFAEKDQTGFIAYMSADGNLLRPAAAASCPIKWLVQAAS